MPKPKKAKPSTPVYANSPEEERAATLRLLDRCAAVLERRSEIVRNGNIEAVKSDARIAYQLREVARAITASQHLDPNVPLVGP